MKLSDRIKLYYEDRFKTYLMRRAITIIRLDGKGFSKYTNSLDKPFDEGFSEDMIATAGYLCENIQGAKFAYTQSDEISIVMTDFDTLETDAWYDNNVQKITSIAASLATAKFNQLRMARACFDDVIKEDAPIYKDDIEDFKLATFDARVFQVPTVDEMINTMIWRQQDATRNSVSMAAYAHFGDKKTKNKNNSEKQEMLFQEKGINWNDYAVKFKRGTVVKKEKVEMERNGQKFERNKWLADYNTPIFSQNKEYLEKLIPTK
jgi:tRNA(His) 5'-end guanylyltransferase